jgi:biopolymer transport protein TolR
MSQATEVQDAAPQFDQEFIRLRLRRRRRGSDGEMDITPMIDIVFLLLIYFIVASRPETNAAVDLPRARFGEPVAGTKAVVLIVRDGATTGTIRVFDEKGTKEIASGDPEQQQEAIAQYVLGQLQGASEDGPKETVLIEAEQHL